MPRESSTLRSESVAAIAVSARAVAARSAGSILLAVALLCATHTTSAEEDVTPETNGIWITVGADAFTTLSAQEGLAFGDQPLAKIAEHSSVVLTRVRSADIQEISTVIHQSHQRCGGFMRHSSFGEARAALARSGEVAGAPITYTINHPERVMQLDSDLEQARILATIEDLSTQFNNRYHAHPSGTAGAEWIRDQWQAFAEGRPDVTVELFNHPTTPQPSVILTITGTTRPDEVVVFGAHLDSIGPGTGNPNFLAPGADDDASGIAVLSETIRTAMVNDFRPQRTVSFMGYAAEEIGLVGSQDIAQTYQDNGTNVVAVLQLDLTAFMGSVEDISLITDNTNPELTAFLGDLIDTYQPLLTWSMSACGFSCSDHASWNSRGYPAAIPTEARFGQHNQFIHTTSDITSTFGDSAAHAFKFARLSTAFLVEVGLDGAEELFDDGFDSGTTGEWSETTP